MRSTAFSSTTFFAEAKRIARYFVVGGIAACVDIGLFVLLARGLEYPYYLYVSAGTFVAATLVNYLLSIRFVFVSGARFRRRHEVLLVFVVSAIGLAVNQAILAWGIESGGLDKLPAKLVATGVVFFWNYFARRVFVFGAVRA